MHAVREAMGHSEWNDAEKLTQRSSSLEAFRRIARADVATDA
jgi:hypothetical protein